MKLVFGINYKELRHGIETVQATYENQILPIPDSVILTRQEYDELRAKIAGDAWDAADRFANEQKQYPYGKREGVYNNPDKHQYLLSINSKEK